jgi:pimeloyl-ACP methyl ester carboxylesterase
VKEEVVLVPGLWMPAVIMTFLGARLARAGYRPCTFAYSGRSGLEASVEQLARLAAERSGAHFVGHSLGGVLIYDMLARHRQLAAGRIVLVGAPVNGCFAGRRLAGHALGRWMLGATTARWRESAVRWPRTEALGVVAGTRPLGLGRALGALPGENDGVVCVAETTVEGMADRVLVPLGHSMLAVSRRVSDLVERFLRAGRFT